MDKLIPVGRIFFAIAIIGMGLEHFIYQEFITGRAPPWPEAIPGGPIWAYVSGLVIVVTGAAILAGKNARAAAILLAALLFVWALLRHIPVVATSEILSPDWTKAVKALALVGGALAVAATFPKVETARSTLLSRFINREVEFIVVGTICLAVFMINNGSQHFIYTEFVASLIPTWFPGNPVFSPGPSSAQKRGRYPMWCRKVLRRLECPSPFELLFQPTAPNRSGPPHFLAHTREGVPGADSCARSSSNRGLRSPEGSETARARSL